jgi:aspartate racemase
VSREREARDFEFEADFRTRTIGMIGGMSWESSAICYGMVNEAVKERLGGHHSADTLMYSVDFAPIKRLQHESRWEETAASLARAARKVEQGGAGFVVLRTNSLHRMADAITEAVSIPLLHIIDATAEEIKARGIKRVGLLATRFTMVRDFYKRRLANNQKQWAASFPLGRMGAPEDVALATLYLASESSSWLTGVTLDVAGAR